MACVYHGSCVTVEYERTVCRGSTQNGALVESSRGSGKLRPVRFFPTARQSLESSLTTRSTLCVHSRPTRTAKTSPSQTMFARGLTESLRPDVQRRQPLRLDPVRAPCFSCGSGAQRAAVRRGGTRGRESRTLQRLGETWGVCFFEPRKRGLAGELGPYGRILRHQKQVKRLGPFGIVREVQLDPRRKGAEWLAYLAQVRRQVRKCKKLHHVRRLFNVVWHLAVFPPRTNPRRFGFGWQPRQTSSMPPNSQRRSVHPLGSSPMILGSRLEHPSQMQMVGSGLCMPVTIDASRRKF